MIRRVVALVLAFCAVHSASAAADGDRIVGVAPGYLHGCALTAQGEVYCWGMDHVNGRPEATTVAGRVEGLAPAAALASGHVNSCILDRDGAAWCWGMDLQASVRESRAEMAGPRRVQGLPPAAMIATGFLHACAISRDDGSVWCWGANQAGELGDGTTIDRAVPVRAGELTGATWIAAGVNNSCAALDTGEVHCWGTDFQGGEGQIIASRAPRHIGLRNRAVKVGNGRNFVCALTVARDVQCFGSNIMNQLGDRSFGSSYGKASPRNVVSAADIGAGGFFACALLRDGKVTCWGHIPHRGDWNMDSSDPAEVKGLSGVRGLGVGLATACALVSDGRVLCWGNNQTGQTGNGRLSDVEETPVEVKGLPGERVPALHSAEADPPQETSDMAERPLFDPVATASAPHWWWNWLNQRRLPGGANP